MEVSPFNRVHFMRVPYRDPGSFMLRLSVTFVHPETLVGVENRRIFGYYIGENGKKAVLLFVQ